MRDEHLIRFFRVFLCFSLFFPVLSCEGSLSERSEVPSLRDILPEVNSWLVSEEPQNYIPATLYEYINGAAEIYLSYDFKELIVGQYKKERRETSLSVEIYDMGNEKNAFGIYSVERFPESHFLSIGNQGYLEEGTLNFIIGKYYIKLLCFDCSEEVDTVLKSFSEDIVERVSEGGQIPSILSHFPQQGLVQNSEKFILKNFFGYGFLHDGYLANYRLESLEFDCFIIIGKNEEDAQNMLKHYLEKRGRSNIQEISGGYLVKDRYYHNIYLARVAEYICGVMKIKEEFQDVGKKYFMMLRSELNK